MIPLTFGRRTGPRQGEPARKSHSSNAHLAPAARPVAATKPSAVAKVAAPAKKAPAHIQATVELSEMPNDSHSRPDVFGKLNKALQRALVETGYEVPTPIQAQAIGPVLDGKDVLGCAQTGTGKTAAFSLPILHNLSKNHVAAHKGHPQVLILAPTRELAAQIGECIGEYGKHLGISRAVIFGGVKASRQILALNQGVDILVATPGRLLDLMNQGYVKLNKVSIFVLDEADRMLDMGFIRDITKVIAALPPKRQTLFFSATMPEAVAQLASSLLNQPVRISVTPQQPAVERIVQSMYFVGRNDKLNLLVSLLEEKHLDKVLVFVQMKHVANKIEHKLIMAGISATALHGNKSQNARTDALERFKKGQVRVLVATDIAARGIDVDNISHVINFELPLEPQTYIHRIGRTARAGAEGDAISFCSAEERDFLRQIEGLLHLEIPAVLDHRWHDESARTATGSAARPPARKHDQQQRASRDRQRMERPGRGQYLKDPDGTARRSGPPRRVSGNKARPKSGGYRG